MSSYTSWYRTGSVSTTQGSNVVTGDKTYWKTAGIHAGDIFKFGKLDYEVSEVVSDTSITLTEAVHISSNNSSYAIIRNFTANVSAEIAAKTIELLGKFMKYINTDMQTVEGKSAYDIAVEMGFTGTQEQWLESLKAANEWGVLDSRTAMIKDCTNPTALHNTHYRGKHLGNAFTPEQMEAIANGTFNDLWLGDYWTGANGRQWSIAGFDYHWDGYVGSPTRHKHHIALISRIIVWNTDDYEAKYWLPDQTLSAYTDSNYFVNVRPHLIQELEDFFGADHLFPWGEFSYTCDASGLYTGCTPFEAKCEIPWLYNYKGIPYVQTGGRGAEADYNLYFGEGQFPLFRISPQDQIPYHTAWGSFASHACYRDLVGRNEGVLANRINSELAMSSQGKNSPFRVYCCVM